MIEKLKLRETWMTFALTWVMVALVAIAIGQAELVRTFEMTGLLLSISFVAYLAGVALAKSRFPGLTAHIYSLVYGAFATAFFIGRTYPADMIWRERVADIVLRQVDWFTKALNGGTSRDALIFVIHTSVIIWVLGYTAAWYTYRKPRLWRVVLPSGLVLLSVVYYYFGSNPLVIYLALYCVLALLYIALTHLESNRREWQFRAVRYDSSIMGIFLRSSLMLALIALIAAWQMPALAASTSVSNAVDIVDEPWRQFREDWQRLFSALNAQTSTTSDPYRDSLTLGGPRNVSDTPIMDIYVEEQLPYAYWRSAVLDRYVDGSWRVAEGETVELYPDDPPLNVPRTRARIEIDQFIVNYVPNAGTVYSAPDLIHSDRQLFVRTALDASGAALVSAVRSRFVLQLGDRYEVTSLLSVADEAGLRRSSTDYPTYIREQYIPIPDTITQRTIDLAAELTAPFDNPYDKAIAVQNWLRNNIQYNDQIDAPPPDAEPVDYLLFDLQEGYCNYYASAFAIMLRSQGVPARLSRGYAAGEFNEDNNLYRVRASDAHTWPEVYFEGYGWIQFEPTVIINPVERPEGSGEGFIQPAAEDDEPAIPDNREQPQFDDENPDDLLEDARTSVPDAETGLLGAVSPLRMAAAVVMVLLAAAAIVTANRMNQRVEGSVDGSYGRLATWARWLGLPVAVSQTPFERADLLAVAVPEGEQPIRSLTNEFVRTRYSREKQQSLFFNPALEWARLRPILIRKGVYRRLPVWLQQRLKG